MFCGKCNREDEEEGKKRKRGRRGEEEKGKKKRKRPWSTRRRGGGRREKRGGGPRSLNRFLFLVQGNNQQLGGRLEDELIFLIFGIGQPHFDKMKGSRDE